MNNSGREDIGYSTQPISYLPQPNFITPVFLSQGQPQPFLSQNDFNTGMYPNLLTGITPFTQFNTQSSLSQNTQSSIISNINASKNIRSDEYPDKDNIDVGESGVNNFPWQVVHYNKRKRGNNQTPEAHMPEVNQSNMYSSLRNLDGDNNPSEENTNSSQKPKETAQKTIPKPPPIFVHGVVNYEQMLNTLAAVAEEDKFFTKCLAENVVKINAKTPETYRSLVKYMKERNIVYHTYQMKEEKPYRVVLKHLHSATPINDIKEELENVGFEVRNIINIRQRSTKIPLPMFFVDLEPAENNKNIYKLNYLQNKVIEVEPPRKRFELVQCTRCQQYNHTKSYCNRPYACVKCGGSHDTKKCMKSRETPAKCILCDGAHPANYKGCQVYRELQNKYQDGQQQPKRSINEYRQNTGQITYAQLTKNNADQTQSNSDINLIQFLNEFKGMFNQLMQQNNMVLNMLSTVINKMAK